MKKVPEAVRKELAALSRRPENEIDFSDLPESGTLAWGDATRGQCIRERQVVPGCDAQCR